MNTDKDPVGTHKKMNDIIDLMKKTLLDSVDVLLITNPTNIRYLTGFVGAAPEEREAYELVTHDQTYLFTNALYREEGKELASLKRLNLLGTKGLTFIETSHEHPFMKKLADILKRLNPAKQGLTLKNFRLDFEENDLTVAEYEKLKKELPGITLIPTQGRIEKLRMMKQDDEIKNIRAAAKLTDQCFDFILDKLKAGLTAGAPPYRQAGSTKTGVTETEIAWEIEAFIRTRGAELAFSPIVAFNSNTSQPH